MYIFKEITKEDCEIFGSWLKHEDINKWIGIDDWDKYFDFVNSEPDYFLIKALLDNKIIGEIALEIIDEIGYIAMMINPDEQSKGHGRKILVLFLQQINQIIDRNIKYIESGIFSDNIASKKCFESAGFKFAKNGDDGEMLYIYDIENN